MHRGVSLYANQSLCNLIFLQRLSNRNNTRNGKYVYPDEAGEGVNVYVVDTGVMIDHPEFEGRAKWGVSTVENGSHVDGQGHGTHVAGTIASKNYGVAKKANIIGVRVFDSRGAGDLITIVQGLCVLFVFLDKTEYWLGNG